MTEYGTQDMLHDLETLAAAGAYRSMSFETLFHAARAIAQDPMMNPGSSDTMMVTPSEEQQQNRVMELMKPLTQEVLSDVMRGSIYEGISSYAEEENKRTRAICDKFEITRDKWDSMSPWERSWFEREYEFM